MKIIFFLIVLLILTNTLSYSVHPDEISRTEFYSIREYRDKSLNIKNSIKINENNWQYLEYYWKVHFNSKNQVLAEKLYERGRLIAYWSYIYQTDGRIIRKGFHWGGIRDGVYYDMGWKDNVLKRGFSYYNERFKYEVYDKNKLLVYEEFYKDGRFDHFVRYYYDSDMKFIRIIRSYEKHLRGRYYDYIYYGTSRYPHSVPRRYEEGSQIEEQERADLRFERGEEN